MLGVSPRNCCAPPGPYSPHSFPFPFATAPLSTSATAASLSFSAVVANVCGSDITCPTYTTCPGYCCVSPSIAYGVCLQLPACKYVESTTYVQAVVFPAIFWCLTTTLRSYVTFCWSLDLGVMRWEHSNCSPDHLSLIIHLYIIDTTLPHSPYLSVPTCGRDAVVCCLAPRLG